MNRLRYDGSERRRESGLADGYDGSAHTTGWRSCLGFVTEEIGEAAGWRRRETGLMDGWSEMGEEAGQRLRALEVDGSEGRTRVKELEAGVARLGRWGRRWLSVVAEASPAAVKAMVEISGSGRGEEMAGEDGGAGGAWARLEAGEEEWWSEWRRGSRAVLIGGQGRERGGDGEDGDGGGDGGGVRRMWWLSRGFGRRRRWCWPEWLGWDAGGRGAGGGRHGFEIEEGEEREGAAGVSVGGRG